MIPKTKKCNKTKKRILLRNNKSFQKKTNFIRIINDDVTKNDKIYIGLKHLTKENQQLFNKALQKHSFNSEVYIPHSLELKKCTHISNKYLLYQLLLAENKIKDNEKIIIEFVEQTNKVTNNYKVVNEKKRNTLKSNMNPSNLEEYLNDNITLFKNKDSDNIPSILKTHDYKSDKELLSKYEKKLLLKKNMNSLNSKILDNFNKNINLTNNFILENLNTNLETNKNSNKNVHIIKSMFFTEKVQNNMIPEDKEYIKELKLDINNIKKSIELLETPKKITSKQKSISNYIDNYKLYQIKNAAHKKNNVLRKSFSGKYLPVNTNFDDFKFQKNSSNILNMLTKTESVKKIKNLINKNSLFKKNYSCNINYVPKTRPDFIRRFSRGVYNEFNFTPQKKCILNFDGPNTMDTLIDKYRLVYNKSKELAKLYKMIKKYEGKKINQENSDLIENEIKRYFIKYPNEITQLNKFKKNKV